LTLDGETVNTAEIRAFESDQEETDVRVILYYSYAESQEYKQVRGRNPNSDIFFILLYYDPNVKIRILIETGTRDRQRLIDVTDIAKDFTPTYSAALLGLHAYIQCDTTSEIKGIGKVKPISAA